MAELAPSSSTLGDDFASRRLYRLMSMSLGITAVVETASVASAILEQRSVLGVAFTVVAPLVITVPSAIALVVFGRAPIPVLRVLWRIQALGMLAMYVALPLALAGGSVPDRYGLTWTSEVEVVAACAAVLAWRVRGVVFYMLIWQSAVFGFVLLHCQERLVGRAFGDALRQLFFVTMFMLLAGALLRAGKTLDDTIGAAVQESRQLAAAESRRTARDRVQMLVHDHIIVALLAYANGTQTSRARIEAAAALREIRQGPRRQAGDLSPRQLAWKLQALTTRLDPTIRFDYTFRGERPVSADVSAVFEEALAEALRNSLRHAGPSGESVLRQVNAEVAPDYINVVVLDNGCGFDLHRIEETRLGVRQGIIRRMEGVQGGHAEVYSVRGHGTTVTLVWERP